RTKFEGMNVMDIVLTDAPEEPVEGPMQVGRVLQRLRRARKWTLQDASDATGISLSTLSKIEREELSPTVTTLVRMAAGFKVEVASFLSEHATQAPISGRRSITYSGKGKLAATGTCDNVWLCSDLARKKMTPIRTRVRARSVNEYAEWARYNAEIFLTVLEGRMMVHSEIYAPVELGPGDSMYYDASARHAWTSVSEEDAIVLWVHTQ
ncbi:MAG TPA: XRE family transcriptional regulator, partial [Sphingomicrobium sp.]|nr:XRE family transcriptional regulator [Sphingomicrobium sp.]